MIDYRPIIISLLVLNVLVINDLVAYSGSANFFKFSTIVIDLFIIALAIFDLVRGISKKDKYYE